MEENEEEKEIESKEMDGRSIARVQESFSKIDTGKAMIVVFMLAAAMCTLIGVLCGYNYANNSANEQLTEYFDTHFCVEGTHAPSGIPSLIIPEFTNEIG